MDALALVGNLVCRHSAEDQDRACRPPALTDGVDLAGVADVGDAP